MPAYVVASVRSVSPGPEALDAAAARGWYESAQYAPLRELRRSVSVTDIVLVEGVDAGAG
ncbi:MAG TPA: DUF1330 domain-containing protein [Solirubrobacteraceae bacterium]|jgi:hypothetical protein